MTNVALESIKNKVRLNQIFKLKDLFEGCEWNSFEKRDRLNFGKYFKNEVLDNRIFGVKFVGKDKLNHANYIKSEE